MLRNRVPRVEVMLVASCSYLIGMQSHGRNCSLASLTYQVNAENVCEEWIGPLILPCACIVVELQENYVVKCYNSYPFCRAIQTEEEM